MAKTQPAHEQHHEIPATPLFAGLTEADWPEVLATAIRLDLGPGEPVFLEGEPGADFFVVMAGAVQVTVHTPQGDVPLAELGHGSVLGEISLLLGGPHSVSARTTEPSTVLRFPNAAFEHWIASRSAAAVHVLHNLAVTLAVRLRSADDHLADLSKRHPGTTGVVRSDLDKLRKIFNNAEST